MADREENINNLFSKRLTPILTNTLIALAVLGLYESRIIPAFSLISRDVLNVLWLFLATYTSFGIASSLLRKGPLKESHGQLSISFLWKVVRRKYNETNKEEKTSVLVILVKAFFLPIMISFMLSNAGDMLYHFQYFLNSGLSLTSGYLFPLILSALLLIDVTFFVFGYSIEHPRLKNTFRSVDSTISGWFFTLICYPPFNASFVLLFGWYASDSAIFTNTTLTTIAGIVSVILFMIYLSATISLGAKCSNLTNRGIVSRGPYSLVRHPAYAAKNAAWIISVIPLMNPVAFLSVSIWVGVYYMRAVTEERHLLKDPEYQEYVKKVRFKFIPYIW